MTPLEQAWADFIQYRKEIKSPMTPIGAKKLRNKLDVLSHGNPRLAIAILDQTIETSRWLGLFPLNEQNAEMFRVAELERMRTRTVTCEYCGVSILASNKWSHEDSECTKFRAKDREEVLAEISKLKMGAN